MAWEISSLFNWKDFTSCLLIYREIRVIDRPPFSREFFSKNKFIIPNLILKIFNQIREISIGVDNKKERLENDIYICASTNRIFNHFSKSFYAFYAQS